MPEKTQVRSIQNALAFDLKRPCVLNQMHLRFKSNALAFFLRGKCAGKSLHFR